MVAKYFTFFALVAVTAAGVIPVGPVSKVLYAEPEAPVQYEYSYSVQDSQTGDLKQLQESRSGDDVRGSYSLVQPDGLTRIVDYTSDDQQGFNAVVRYEGNAIQPAPAKIAYAPAPITKVAYAPSPFAKVAYAPAPITKVAYAAPAPISYAPAPITYAPAPVTYAAAVPKLAYAAGPIAKIGYTENLGRVSFSSPDISYQH